MYEKDYNEPLWSTAEELNRNECFNDLAYRSMTFARDDRPDHILSKAAPLTRRTSRQSPNSTELCSRVMSARERRSMPAVSRTR